MKRCRARLRVLLLLPFLAAAACAYKIEIKQGNDALLDNLSRLEIGMTRSEVRELLGPPPAPRLFKDNVWIYLFQRRASGFIGEIRLRSVELVFNDSGVLQEINLARDDYAEAEAAAAAEAEAAAEEETEAEEPASEAEASGEEESAPADGAQ